MNNLEVSLFSDNLNRQFLQLKPSNNSKFNVESVKVSIFSSYSKRYYNEEESWGGQETFLGPCTVAYPDVVYFGTTDYLTSFMPDSHMKIKAGDLEWEGTFPAIAEKWNDVLPNRDLWVGEPLTQIGSEHVVPEVSNSKNEKSNKNNNKPKPTEPTKPRSWNRYWLVSTAIAFGVLLFAFWPKDYSLFDIGELFEKDSQCTVNDTPSKTIVLFDGTDEFFRSYSPDVKICLNNLVESIPLNGLLEFRLMDNKDKAGEVVFSKCNSGGTDWLNSYNESIDQTLKSLEQISESQSTPILSWLQLIAQEHFADVDNSQFKRLIMVSDMIEHSSNFSHYDDSTLYSKFRESDAYNKYKTDFQGAEVEFCMLGRKDSNLNLRELINFWTLWIKENGGQLNRQAVK